MTTITMCMTTITMCMTTSPDETALSNLNGFFTYSNWTSGLRSVPCNHPHLEFLEQPALRSSQQGAGALSWLRQVLPGLKDGQMNGQGAEQGAAGSRPLLCSAPPLRAVRDLYHVLLDNDYTVVGRVDGVCVWRCVAAAKGC